MHGFQYESLLSENYENPTIFRHCWKEYSICTDSSQAALNSISFSVIKSMIVKDCLAMLYVLGASNSIDLVWVPSHTNVDENEITDMLGKHGSDSLFILQEAMAFNWLLWRSKESME